MSTDELAPGATDDAPPTDTRPYSCSARVGFQISSSPSSRRSATSRASPCAGVYGSIAARLVGVPVVWHVRGRISPDYLPATAVWLVRFMTRRLAARVIANFTKRR